MAKHTENLFLVRGFNARLKLIERQVATLADNVATAATINGALYKALEESVKLQSHYAKLLNMHDGGKRMSFENTEEWIRRVESRESRVESPVTQPSTLKTQRARRGESDG